MLVSPTSSNEEKILVHYAPDAGASNKRGVGAAVILDADLLL